MHTNAHYQHRANLDNIQHQIKATNPQARLDLLKMWRTCDNLFQELDKELVTCRRKQRLTAKYQEQEAKLLAQITTLEKRITFALFL